MQCNQGLGAYQKWHIGAFVRALLVADSGVTEIVGSNIYPLVAPEPKTGTKDIGNFIVYGRDKYGKEMVKQGVFEDDCQIQIIAVCNNYDTACDLAELIDNALAGTHWTEDGHRITIQLTDSNETFDDMKYIETLYFKIK